jgi:hypothetical protein
MVRLYGHASRGVRLVDHVPFGNWETITSVRSAALIRLIIWPSAWTDRIPGCQELAHVAHRDRRPGLAIVGLTAHPVERDGSSRSGRYPASFADNLDSGWCNIARVPPVLTRGTRTSWQARKALDDSLCSLPRSANNLMIIGELLTKRSRRRRKTNRQLTSGAAK